MSSIIQKSTATDLPKPNAIEPLRYHPVQQKLIAERKYVRFAIIHSGRRSGKTEIAKRHLSLEAMNPPWLGAHFFAAGPTRAQAKDIWWEDLKKYTKEFHSRKPLETELKIFTTTGAQIHIIGLDKPQRMEGTPWAGGVVTEVANCGNDMWEKHMRPSLSTPGKEGWAWLEGVPEGKNWLDRLVTESMKNTTQDWHNRWGIYHWPSVDILSPREIEAVMATMDPLTFAQEYGGEFVEFAGRAYYGYTHKNHKPAEYDPYRELIFCFDFNISPGVCAVLQEFGYGTHVIGEVYIKKNSTTEIVCDKLINDWKNHKGPVACYGDPTGGAGGSAKVAGSDWDIIQRKLRIPFKNPRYRIPRSSPREKARVNAVNSRLHSMSDEVKLFVDTVKAPNVDNDFNLVRRIEGGTGEIDKKHDLTLSHLSDAIGYYITLEYPVRPEFEDEISAQEIITQAPPI